MPTIPSLSLLLCLILSRTIQAHPGEENLLSIRESEYEPDAPFLQIRDAEADADADAEAYDDDSMLYNLETRGTGIMAQIPPKVFFFDK